MVEKQQKKRGQADSYPIQLMSDTGIVFFSPFKLSFLILIPGLLAKMCVRSSLLVYGMVSGEC